MPEALTLETKALVIKRDAKPISQLIRPGEIVGLAGLDGHGQERFLETLAGLKAPVTGDVYLDRSGDRTRISGFRKAVSHGIAYLPRDRRGDRHLPHAICARTISRSRQLAVMPSSAC